MLQLRNSLHAGDDPAGFELGFDDGDVRLFNDDELEQTFKSGILKALDMAEGGLVANEAGWPAAAEFVYLSVCECV